KPGSATSSMSCSRRAIEGKIAMTAPARAALYLRVSTGRQADNDLSIPDQRRQARAYCASRGWEIVADYVEPGVSATDDKRPEFQRMIDAATTKPPTLDVIVVHSFSRFFRDQFQLEFYVRRLAKNGVRLVSITQELGDDPTSNMIRQIMALFDEYQSKENAKADALEAELKPLVGGPILAKMFKYDTDPAHNPQPPR